MKLIGTLAEIKSASKQLRKYGWENVDLEQLTPDGSAHLLTIRHTGISTPNARSLARSQGPGTLEGSDTPGG